MQTKLGKKVVAALASHFRTIQNSGQKVDILMHHKRAPGPTEADFVGGAGAQAQGANTGAANNNASGGGGGATGGAVGANGGGAGDHHHRR